MYESVQEYGYLLLAFSVSPSVFLALVQSSLHMCTFLSIGIGRGILIPQMLEIYNLLSHFPRKVYQDITLSVRRDFRHLNSVGPPTNF